MSEAKFVRPPTSVSTATVSTDTRNGIRFDGVFDISGFFPQARLKKTYRKSRTKTVRCILYGFWT